MAVLAVVDDLVFRGKIESAATHLGVVLSVAPDSSATLKLLGGVTWSLVIVDLDLAASQPLELIRAVRQVVPTAQILGYCSHVQVDLQKQAKRAGCTSVLTRAAFVQGLPALLAGT
mgnify:FL=1